MNDIVFNIVIGAIGSIVATIILFFLSKTYKMGYKDDFNFYLIQAKTAVYQIENQHLFPDDYELVIEQVDVLYNCAYNMYKCISPLSLLRRRTEKKLINTILYDIIRVCELSKCVTVGYDETNENRARLSKIHKYFYKGDMLNKTCNISIVGAQIELLKALINGNKYTKAITDTFKRELHDKKDFWDIFSLEFIDINSFQSSDQTVIKRKGLTSIKFEEMIERAKNNNKYRKL